MNNMSDDPLVNQTIRIWWGSRGKQLLKRELLHLTEQYERSPTFDTRYKEGILAGKIMEEVKDDLQDVDVNKLQRIVAKEVSSIVENDEIRPVHYEVDGQDYASYILEETGEGRYLVRTLELESVKQTYQKNVNMANLLVSPEVQAAFASLEEGLLGRVRTYSNLLHFIRKPQHDNKQLQAAVSKVIDLYKEEN